MMRCLQLSATHFEENAQACKEAGQSVLAFTVDEPARKVPRAGDQDRGGVLMAGDFGDAGTAAFVMKPVGRVRAQYGATVLGTPARATPP